MNLSSGGIPAGDTKVEGVSTEKTSRKNDEPRRMHFFCSEKELEQLQDQMDAARGRHIPISHRYVKLDDGVVKKFSGCRHISGDESLVPAYPHDDVVYLGIGVWDHCEKGAEQKKTMKVVPFASEQSNATGTGAH
jgi:hypothetical protein